MWKRWTVGIQDGLQSLSQEKGEVSVSEGIMDRQLHTFPIPGDSWMNKSLQSPFNNVHHIFAAARN